MKLKKPLAGLALAASALTGAGASAIALAPTVASAQETQAPNDDQQQAPNDQQQAPNDQNREGPRRGHHGPKLDAAAEAIGIEVDELREALRNGQTVAQVAQAHNVSVDTVINAMVDDAREHITAFVNGEKPERPADAPNGDQPNQGDEPNQQDEPPASSGS